MRFFWKRLPLALVALPIAPTGFAPQAAAQAVEVDAPGTEVRVGPDGAGGGGVKVQAPGVKVQVQRGGAGGGGGGVVEIGPEERASEQMHLEAAELQAQAQAMQEQAAKLQAEARALAEQAKLRAVPAYWLGLMGGEISPELRAQLGLEGVGVLVREVVPEGPAAKAGFLQHDILVRSGDQPIASMEDLVGLVSKVGAEGGTLEIEAIRAGKPITIAVKPEQKGVNLLTERPIEVPAPFQFRVFGPGGIVQGGMPQGQAVQVQTQSLENYLVGDIAVKIVSGAEGSLVTVQRGENSWNLKDTSPESLESLPPDVRGVVQGLLAGRGKGAAPGNVGVNVDLSGIEAMLPNMPEFFQNRRMGRTDIKAEVEALQRQVEELRRQFGVPAPDVAPAFEPQIEERPIEKPQPPKPPQAPPAKRVEIEVPAESK